ATPRAGRRQPGRARLRPRLGAAAVEGQPGARELDAPPAPYDGVDGPEPGGSPARDRLPAERLASARDDRAAQRARRGRGRGACVAAGCAYRRFGAAEARGLEGPGAGTEAADARFQRTTPA